MHISLFLTSRPYALLLLQQVKNQNVLNLFNKHRGQSTSFGTGDWHPSTLFLLLFLSPPPTAPSTAKTTVDLSKKLF